MYPQHRNQNNSSKFIPSLLNNTFITHSWTHRNSGCGKEDFAHTRPKYQRHSLSSFSQHNKEKGNNPQTYKSDAPITGCNYLCKLKLNNARC